MPILRSSRDRPEGLLSTSHLVLQSSSFSTCTPVKLLQSVENKEKKFAILSSEEELPGIGKRNTTIARENAQFCKR